VDTEAKAYTNHLLHPDDPKYEQAYLDAKAARDNYVPQGTQGNTSINTVTVISPDGVEGTIPAVQLQDALAQGYKQKQ
jgi:hypothetical protein